VHCQFVRCLRWKTCWNPVDLVDTSRHGAAGNPEVLVNNSETSINNSSLKSTTEVLLKATRPLRSDAVDCLWCGVDTARLMIFAIRWLWSDLSVLNPVLVSGTDGAALGEVSQDVSTASVVGVFGDGDTHG
jgi:hypothetical protein